jgi:hypothetical protein
MANVLYWKNGKSRRKQNLASQRWGEEPQGDCALGPV